MLVLTFQKEETFGENANLVNEENKNQLDSLSQKIAQESGFHLHFSTKILQSSNRFQRNNIDIFQSIANNLSIFTSPFLICIVQKNTLVIIHE